MDKPFVELPVNPDLSTPDGMREHMRSITTNLNDLALKQARGKFITEEEWRASDEAIKQLGARTKSIDDTLKSQRDTFAGGSDAFTMNRAALRLEMPEDMSRRQREYFNLAVLRWEEIAGLSHLGQRDFNGMGLSTDVARLGSSSNSDRLRDVVTRFQRLNDELLVTDVLMFPADSRTPDLNSRLHRLKQLKAWPEYERLVNELCDSMKHERPFNEGTANAGLAWVPTILSSQLMDLVQVWSKVAPLFTPITMTSKILDWPVLGADLTAFLMTEAVADTGADTPIGASTATTTKAMFTAKKFGVRTYASSEILEDSVVPMVPFIINNAAKVLARAIEDCIINGDTAGTMDLGSFNNVATGVRRAWMGLRQHCLVTASYPAKVDAGGGVSTTKLLDLQYAMGAWGASPAPLAWITGFHGLKSAMKMSELITLEKFGPQASILSGQVANLFGSPVILSEFVTEKDATGIHSATPANNVKGSILCVHRDSYGLATRRGISVNGSSDRHIEVDQVVFVATARNDFQAFYAPSATNTPVGILYNIT
jgi:HK97 family phage major capsid protein